MKPKRVNVNENGEIDIREFDEFLDIDKVAYYSFSEGDDGTLTITFYDENKDPIPLFVR